LDVSAELAASIFRVLKLGSVNANIVDRMKYVDYTGATGRGGGNLYLNFTLTYSSVKYPSRLPLLYERSSHLFCMFNKFPHPNHLGIQINLVYDPGNGGDARGVFKKRPNFLNSAPTSIESALRLLSAPIVRF
jgi:hypothetical protein